MSSLRKSSLVLAFVVSMGCGDKYGPAGGGGVDAGPCGVTYDGQIKGLLDSNCIRCHSSTRQGSDRSGAPAEVNFDTFEAAARNSARARVRIEAGTMPRDTGALPDEQKALFAAWVEGGVRKDCASPVDDAGSHDAGPPRDGGGEVTYCDGIKPLLEANCTRCHSSSKEGPDRNGAPEGVNFDSYDGISARKDAAREMVTAGAMPPTGPLPEDDQALFAEWVDEGAPECDR